MSNGGMNEDDWREVARVLRDHTPLFGYSDGVPVLVCKACGDDYPCRDWTRASGALNE